MAERAGDAGTLAVTRSEAGGYSVLAPSHSLTFENCKILEGAFREATAGHEPKVVLDCKAVGVLDSEALEMLLRMHTEMEQRGGRLRLIHLNAVCSDILMVTRLIHTLQVHPDLPEATRSG